MLELNFNPFPVLTTERLVLRQMNEGDAQEMFFLRSDERVMKYLDRKPAQSVDEALAFIKMINTAIANNESINWAITLKGDSRIIGDICFWRIDGPNYRAEVGYRLHPEQHGKGIMNEALMAILDYGFNVMKLHSVEANTNPENQASIKLLERNGFVREGYFKENYFFDGKFLDSAVYSLVKPMK
jgi:ribosomal-protein-alanine N-acetyltransferase